MNELDNLAVQGTPLAADLRGAAPGLTTLSRNLPAFNRSATTGLQALGRASVTGRSALRKGRDEIKQLGKSAKKSFATADDLTKFLRDIDDPNRAVEVDARAARDSGRKAPTGYTGMEGLLNYLYYQTLAINQYDEVGHLLHFSIFEVATAPCSEYNAGMYHGQVGVPNADGSAATTDVRQANRCVAWLGDSQPDINEPLNLPPYDPSVCPDGSTDTSLCDPAGTLTGGARVRSSGSGRRRRDGAGRRRPRIRERRRLRHRPGRAGRPRDSGCAGADRADAARGRPGRPRGRQRAAPARPRRHPRPQQRQRWRAPRRGRRRP